MRKPPPLPLDVKLMNTFSVVLGWVFACTLLVLGANWLMRQPMFFLEAIRIQGELTHNNAATLRANVAPRLEGNFLTVDLQAARAVFETVPWVRRAVVRREFPNRLKVVLYEHKAVALWGTEGEGRLLNTQGEIFEANPGDIEAEELPILNGPPEKAALVLQAYRKLAVLFEEMDAVLEQLQLSGQGSWSAQLDSGAVIELGHGSPEELQQRTRRFIRTVTQVSSRFGRELESADLRYGNGYALRLKGVTTGESAEADKDASQRKR